MKKLVGILALALLATPIFASGTTIKLNTGYAYTNYKEDAPSRESGSFVKWGINVTQKLPDNSAIVGDFSYAGPTLKYQGETWGGTPLSYNGKHNYFNGSMQYQFDVTSMFDMPVETYMYVGFGYHYWQRTVDATSRVGDYREDYRYMYVPYGVIFNIPVNDKLSVDLNMSISYIFNGTMAGYLSQASSTLNDVKVSLGASYGYKFAATVNYQLTSNWSLFMTPYYECVHLKESNFADAGGGVYVQEPSSTTRNAGVNVGVGLNF